VNEKSFQLADYRVIGIAAALLVIISITALAMQMNAGWRDDQEAVRDWVAENLGAERAAAVPMGLRQIYIEELQRVDRCVTCHTTIDWGPELADAPHPARPHPRMELFANHPIEKFGCTLCHGGQGSATEKEAAHVNIEFWEEPLLGERRADRYGLTAAQLMEMRCNICHRAEAVVEGMPLLNEAKALAKKKRCVRCHMINGRGASKAPDLTREGDKHPSAYHFPEGWTRRKSAFAWHLEHFKEPFAVVPDTMMPAYTFKGQQVEGLSLLVLSWRKQSLPQAWMPSAKAQEEEPVDDPRRKHRDRPGK